MCRATASYLRNAGLADVTDRNLAEWDGTGIVGSAIYSSTLQSGPTAVSQNYTFNTGALAISSGTSYIAFLTVPDMGSLDAMAAFEESNDNSSGGHYFFSFNNDLNALLTGGSSEWQDGAGQQLAFQATFAVPEPSTGVLLGGALLGLFVVARRRRA